MEKIIIHNPCNEHTRYFRNYNLFWDDLTEELGKKYELVENRYYNNAHKDRYKISLKKQTCAVDEFLLLECEYVIEFIDTGEFYVLSVSDTLTHAILNEKNNNSLKKVLVSQFNKNEIFEHVGESNIHKYSPWIYFPCLVYDLDAFYKKRKDIEEFIDKMYFRGSSISDRPIVTLINKNYLMGYESIYNPTNYFDDLIKYKIGLSIAGRGELCYRDIEYMALGIPFIRFEYISELNPKLIPNYHYISIDRPENLTIDRLGKIEHAKMIEKKFLEIKDDVNFLNFISKNSREYYENYLSRDNNVKHTLNLLNL